MKVKVQVPFSCNYFPKFVSLLKPYRSVNLCQNRPKAKMHKKIALPVIFLLFQICQCKKNEVTLYDQPNQQGNNVTLSMSSNLAWNHFDNKAVSVCVSGLMLFYTNTDFTGYMEYVYGGDHHCTNLTHYAGKVSSIRYPGFLEDIKKDSITIYEKGFGGTDYREYGDAFNFGNFHFYSLIITGSSNWTVFDRYNFQGNSACLMVPDPEKRIPCFLPRVQDIPNFGYGIYSGKKGCNDTTLNKVHLVPFAKPISTNTNESKHKSKVITTTEMPTQLKSYNNEFKDTAIIDPLLRLLRSNNTSVAANHSAEGNHTIISVNVSTTRKGPPTFLEEVMGFIGFVLICVLLCKILSCMPTCKTTYYKKTSGC